MKGLGFGLFLLLSSAGCAATQHEAPQSRVGQGLAYSSGNREYDEFFERVHRLQVAMSEAPAALTQARARIVKSTAPGNGSSSTLLAREVKQALDRMSKRGVSVRVDLKRAAVSKAERAHAVFTPTAKPSAQDEKLLADLEAGVSGMLHVSSSLRESREELLQLCTRALQLESSLDEEFPGGLGSRRGEVLANLRDAERVLALSIARSEETARPAEEFISELSTALGKERRSASRASELAERGEARRSSASSPSASARVAQASNEAAEPAAPPQAAPSTEPVTRSSFDP